mgnify:CR=1 FL=1
MKSELLRLKKSFEGELFLDDATRVIYATDASAFREIPLAVAVPKNEADIKKLVRFCQDQKTCLLPRTAGTSLGGQVVGKGIIVDFSKHWNGIIEVNEQEKWVRVQPAVVLDELNLFLKGVGLFFGPETSTANRCMIGGMVGNNSCGSHSILYGSTRDHVLEMKTILSDGSDAEFKSLNAIEFEKKCRGEKLENKLYQHIKTTLSNKETAKEIVKEYPKPEIRRRNNGYAVDLLLATCAFKKSGEAFNFCKLLSGSEGTLAITTEIKLNLVDLPPKEKAVVAVHLNSIHEATRANLIALKFEPGAVELMDDIILECASKNIEQKKNSYFIEGKPKALLIVEFARETKTEIDAVVNKMEKAMRAKKFGYHFPVIYGKDISKVWALRKAGLGSLANIPGDAKAVPCIEDTAVHVEDQPAYIEEFEKLLDKHDLSSIYYAHIGDGEIHLRPILDLKLEKDRILFRTITDEIATLVKKYNGSLSGEHGDGRVRGEFVKKMLGEKNYQLLVELKGNWDPNGVLNPEKIVHAPKMNESLRYESGQKTEAIDTLFDFSETKGILRMAEKCNGSGDCRKSHLIGGTMCPSYMATRDEKDTTRARANMLREFLTRSTKMNKFDHEEIYEVMDTCLSCKGCKSECPSNVDMATLKAEFLQKYYDANGVPFRSWLISRFAQANYFMSFFPKLFNGILSNAVFGYLFKRFAGFSTKRSFPELSEITLRRWAKKNPDELKHKGEFRGKVNLFCDEYTNYNETDMGIKSIRLLTALGYRVSIPYHRESARTHLSKGLVRQAKKIAEKNVQALSRVVTKDAPLIGLEPSAILVFRDEYPKLVREDLRAQANTLSSKTFIIDEWLASEVDKGNLSSDMFSSEEKKIKLHGHCQQKALSSLTFTEKILSLPKNYEVEVINSGCCGMAGAFGFEEEHYDLSMKIGELVLFPEVRYSEGDVIIAAPGTSCRHQILDGTGRKSLHPVEILWESLARKNDYSSEFA